MNKQTREYHAAKAITWVAYAMASAILSIAASWWAFSRIDYGYPLWYQVFDIDQHIARYAPQHPVKRGFAQLPPEQHHQAFAQIVAAVHDRGVALESIVYTAEPWPAQRLLDSAEVQHLVDVRTLMGHAALAVPVVMIVWVLAALAGKALGTPKPRARWVASAAMLALFVSPLLVWGPQAVFYQLHVWLFPEGNQWFFYWQESLMSTLMRAPVLFAGIAVEITLLALLLLPVFYLAGQSVARRLLEAK